MTVTAPTPPSRSWTRPNISIGSVLLAFVAYVPLLLTRPGEVGADTKTYLYLDPGRLLSRAPYMWDPNIGFGTVTHQNIGYLWPMGPFYFVMDAIGLPDWVAQRLWLGSIILIAGLGVRFMLKELRWKSAGVTVAAFAYALSPYLIDYGARISVILLPFCGLPWLIGLAARALRRGDWATPAIFALVTLTVGGVNATSLLLVMVAPMLWFVHATFIEREVTFGRAAATAGRIALLTAITSLWWVAGLMLQGAHGIPILRFTETYETVANASTAPELLRGLGYWFFYGTDGLGAWTEASRRLVEAPFSLIVSYALPLLAFCGALLTRFRHRVFFATIVLLGLVIGVGAHPWDSPSPYGRLFKAVSTSDLGLSFRSTPRAVPLIALGLAVFLGAGLGALSRVRPGWHRPTAAVLLVLICANQLPLFQGLMVDRNLVRDEEVPQYWRDAAAALDAGDRETRVMEIPGIDFASYRWGNTVDPITPGLTDRDYVARELIPYGSPASANFLNEFDQPLQSGRVEPSVFAPLAQLGGIEQFVLRADLQYERYRTPRPRQTWAELQAADGVELAETFGPVAPNVPVDALPLDDEMEFGTPFDAEDPPPVSLWNVTDLFAMLRPIAAQDPTVLSGDAGGIVSLAATGGVVPGRPILYSGSYAGDADALLAQVDEPGAWLVVTDTNRQRARRWGSVRDNDGYTERTGETALVEDNTDNRLDVFPDASDSDRTVAVQRGGATVAASRYGNGVSYTGGDRAVNAMDGDPASAWRVAAFADPVDEFLQVDLDEPTTTDHVELLQPGATNRSISVVSLSFDDGPTQQFTLDDSSRIGEGQRLEFDERTFQRLRVTIDETDIGEQVSYKGISGVGIAELTIAGVGPLSEVIRPASALLDAVGVESLERPLSYVFSRRAANPADVVVSDEEPTMVRLVEGPVQREFTTFGRSRLDATLADDRLDELLGLPNASDGGVTATSTGRLGGDIGSRSSAAVDGDDVTAYQTPINAPLQTLTFTYSEPVTIDDLQLAFVNDGKHSLPASVTVSVDGAAGTSIPLETAPVAADADRGSVESVTVPTGSLTGTTWTLSIDSVTEAGSVDWFGSNPTVLPVALSEIGLPAVAAPDADALVPSQCRSDMVSIDGVGVPLRIVGTVGDAQNGSSLRLESCGADPLTIPAGDSLLETAPGSLTGFDVDLLSLASAAGGGAGEDTLASPLADPEVPGRATTERTGRNSYQLTTEGATSPYWVVLGQSYEPGWTATTSDGVDLGPPTLVNGYANGWMVDPDVLGSDVTVDITWPPQRLIWIGLTLSALGVAACLAIALAGPIRRRWRRRSDPESSDERVALEDRASIGDTEPTLIDPRVDDRSAVAWRTASLATVGVGVVSLLAAGPVSAVIVVVLSLVALRVRRGVVAVSAAALALFGAAALYIVAKQVRRSYPLDFEWMQWFEITHSWALLATVLLWVTVVLDGVRTSRDDPRSAASPD